METRLMRTVARHKSDASVCPSAWERLPRRGPSCAFLAWCSEPSVPGHRRENVRGRELRLPYRITDIRAGQRAFWNSSWLKNPSAKWFSASLPPRWPWPHLFPAGSVQLEWEQPPAPLSNKLSAELLPPSQHRQLLSLLFFLCHMWY